MKIDKLKNKGLVSFCWSLLSYIPLLNRLDIGNENEGKVGLRTLLIRESLGSFVLKIVSTGLAFVTSMFLARALGTKGYGTYAYVLAWVSFLSVLSVVGVDRLLVRNISAYSAKMEWALMRGLLRRSNQIVFVVSLLLVILAAFVGWVLAKPDNAAMLYAFWFALVLLPMFSLIRLRQSSLQGLRKVVMGQMPEMFIRPVLFIFFIVGTYFLLDGKLSAQLVILNLILATVITFLVLTYLYRKYLPRDIKSCMPVYETRLWIKSALPLLFVSSMHMINSRTDIIMLGAMKGSVFAGIYNVANNGAELITFVLFSLNAVLAPVISSVYATRDMEKLQNVITSTARVVLLLTIPIVFVLFFWGNNFLLLFGQEYMRGYTSLAILSTGNLFNIAMGSVGYLLIMTGYEREAVIGFGISAILNVVLNAILIPLWAMEGAAVATASSMVVWNIILAWFVWKRLRIHTTALGKLKLCRNRNITNWN